MRYGRYGYDEYEWIEILWKSSDGVEPLLEFEIYVGNENCFWDFVKILIFQDLKNKVGLINWHLLILPPFSVYM